MDLKLVRSTACQLPSCYPSVNLLFSLKMKPPIKSGAPDCFLDKGDGAECYRNLMKAQKELIRQQKELIDLLAGQIVNSGSSPPAQHVPKQLKYFLKDRPTQFWLTGLLLAIMTISSLIVFFCLYNYGKPNPDAPTFGHDDNLGDDIQVIHRKEWLAREPLKVTKVSGPLKKVRILHTAGSSCKDFQTCVGKVLGLQSWQVSTQGMPDIAYNYLIGGDGNVYVGRGAGVENQWQKDAIDIGYIGNFLPPYDKMTDKMDQAGRKLIERLSKQGYLTPDYIVIAQNQTYNTQSPGDNVYERIVKWPHFDSGLYF